jgi:hypothetical protein
VAIAAAANIPGAHTLLIAMVVFKRHLDVRHHAQSHR